MQPLFLAGHLALDFLNTALTPDGVPVELIGDGRALVDWLVAANLVDAGAATQLSRRLGKAGVDQLAARARELRGWAADWLARWRVAPGASYAPELRRLNDWLAGASVRRQLARRGDRFVLVEQRAADGPDDLLGELARHIAELVMNAEPALVKRCDGAGCTLWFLDRTKGHRRRFCSVAACGNRDKVAAFRARQRARNARSEPAVVRRLAAGARDPR